MATPGTSRRTGTVTADRCSFGRPTGRPGRRCRRSTKGRETTRPTSNSSPTAASFRRRAWKGRPTTCGATITPARCSRRRRRRTPIGRRPAAASRGSTAPCLFPYNGRVYAIARYQATHAKRFAELGGMYSRKRTSLFLVEPERLVYLCDLPSAGDTSYAGIVIQGEELIASYYTGPPDHDITWVLGISAPPTSRSRASPSPRWSASLWRR